MWKISWELMNYIPKIAESQEGKTPGSQPHTLELRNVSYTYRRRVRAGAAPCRYSGARTGETPWPWWAQGRREKSALIKLLLRRDDPTEGSACLDGVDIRQYGVWEYRRLFGTGVQGTDPGFFQCRCPTTCSVHPTTPDEEEQAAQALRDAGVYDRIPGACAGHESGADPGI